MRYDAPQWMVERNAQLAKTGLENLSRYIVPPRIKVVQSQSAGELRRAFGDGSLVVQPENRLLVHRDQSQEYSAPFLFVPIFMWPEYVTIAPYELKGSVPFILDRTQDHTSELAYKCRTRSKWYEPYRGEGAPADSKLQVRHCEHLNFMVLMLDSGNGDLGELAATPLCLTFARGSYTSGQKLCSLVKQRRTAIFCNVMQGIVGPTANAKGQWWTVQVDNPHPDWTEHGYLPNGPFIDETLYEPLREMFDELQAGYDERVLRPEYDDEIVPEATAATSTEY